MSLCLPNSRGIVVTQSNSQRRIARIASRVLSQERTNYQTVLGQIAKSITPVNNRVGGGILRAKYEILRSYYVLFLFLYCECDKICRICRLLFFRSRKNLASSGNKIYSKKGGRKMLQTNLKVVAVGEPNIEALTDGEKRTFFESIFSRIVELHKQAQTENKNET